MTINKRSIQKAFRVNKLDVEIHKGAGYCYFTSEKYDFVYSSVMVPRLSDLTIEQWILEARNVIRSDNLLGS